MKMTNIRMEWTDMGATVFYESSREFQIVCPRCGTNVAPGIEHRCGDQVVVPTKDVAAKKKRAKARGESR